MKKFYAYTDENGLHVVDSVDSLPADLMNQPKVIEKYDDWEMLLLVKSAAELGAKIEMNTACYYETYNT